MGKEGLKIFAKWAKSGPEKAKKGPKRAKRSPTQNKKRPCTEFEGKADVSAGELM